ncbi:hypothetical protein [Paenibacillus thermotolerans]|uniref:hypothetical protein n=1 Tax=Paenibacillus thermotolerans TaxID=3027807 RepID=UPI0023677863|nr:MULTISPECIES: hypothetical protein [unclassified Paenibacillus]
MARVVRVKNYASIVRKALKRIRVKGKVKIKGGCGGNGGASFGRFTGSNTFGAVTKEPFVGPSLQQRLFGWALASTIVTVSLETARFRGRVISVDGNGFEMTVTNPLTSGFIPGSIVFVSFRQVNAVSADG